MLHATNNENTKSGVYNAFLLYSFIRIAAINCILSTKQIHDAADLADIVIRDQVADIVFLMLPKVVATLKNVALGDEKQGQAIIVVSNFFVVNEKS